ncbi:hypothetical protein KB874_18200 [Aestuariicoccus sp. KMU-90]|uniref:Uncharacterized protein n=2 Tax=Thetidibacter halocola TaxID=2827239 RepID=A0A8J7WI28_9RHOB|nr:hypothetical protein [Thetidibacter halocola]
MILGAQAATALLAGLALGLFHFATLARLIALLVAGRMVAVPLQLARFALLVPFLWIAAQFGAAVLLAGAAGILAGRALLLRRLR